MCMVCMLGRSRGSPPAYAMPRVSPATLGEAGQNTVIRALFPVRDVRSPGVDSPGTCRRTQCRMSWKGSWLGLRSCSFLQSCALLWTQSCRLFAQRCSFTAATYTALLHNNPGNSCSASPPSVNAARTHVNKEKALPPQGL